MLRLAETFRTGVAWESSRVRLSPLTAGIQVRLRRPTSARPLDWSDDARVRVSLVETLDGVERIASSIYTGGRRQQRDGTPIPFAAFLLNPTRQARTDGRKRVVERDGKGYLQLTRLGELAAAYHVTVRVELLGGLASFDLELDTVDGEPPTVLHHHSVAFDSATDAQDVTGDGVISLTHDPTGTDNLAAFAGGGNSGSAGRAGSSTYNGVAMTEQWDGAFDTFYAHAGYTKASIPSTSVSVVNTLAGGCDEHFFGVMAFTGVDQTTPAGTPVTTTGVSGTANTVTDTVSDAVAGDVVVDNLYVNSVTTVAAGADQTQRNVETIAGAITGAQSTQDGSVSPAAMSWSWSGTQSFGHGAITMKQAAVGGGDTLWAQSVM